MAMTTIMAAGGLVTNGNNELLMMFRRGKWDLPKGKKDEGETLEQCAVREVGEETGITDLEVSKPVGVTYHTYFEQSIGEEVIKETHWFGMKAPADAPLVPQHEEDIEKIIWADNDVLRQCLENTYPNIREIIEKFRSVRRTE